MSDVWNPPFGPNMTDELVADSATVEQRARDFAPELLALARDLNGRLPWCTCPVVDCTHERSGAALRALLARIDRKGPAVNGNCAGCGKPWSAHDVPLTGVHLRAYERLGIDGKAPR
jgi:hypothetical protein